MVRARPRSTRADSQALWALAPSPPHLEGIERIPVYGPIVVAANHYQRRGLWIGWSAAAIDLALGQVRPATELHWLVTGNLRLMQWRNAGPVLPGSERLFRRVARSYGMSAMPRSQEGRAAALRQWLRHLEAGDACGLFPEGLRGHAGMLVEPEPSVDRVLALVDRLNAQVVPVGIRELGGGGLRIAFGEPVHGCSGSQVMAAIAGLAVEEPRVRVNG